MEKGNYKIEFIVDTDKAEKSVKGFDSDLEEFAGKDQKRSKVLEAKKQSDRSKSVKEQKKANKALTAAITKEYQKRHASFKGNQKKQTQEHERHMKLMLSAEKDNAKKIASLRSQSAGGRAKAKMKEGFDTGGIMGAAKALPGVAKVAGIAGAAIIGLGKAWIDAGVKADQFNNTIKRLGNAAGVSGDQLKILQSDLLAIRRPADMSADAVAKLATTVATFEKPENIAATVETIMDLQRIEPGASMDKIVGSVGRLGKAIGNNQLAMDLIAQQAQALKGKVADPLDEALTELSVVYSKASTVYQDQEKAMRDSAGLLSALVETGVEVSEATTQAEELMLKLNDIANDPKIREGIFEKIPEGFEKLKSGLENGSVGAIEFIQELEKMGPAGNEVAYAIGSTAGEGVQALLKSFEVGGKTISDFTAQFDDVSGAAGRMADEMVSPMTKANERIGTSWDNMMLSIGNSSEGFVSGSLSTLADAMVSVGSWFESPLDGFTRLKTEMLGFNETADQVAMLAGVVGQEISTIGVTGDVNNAQIVMQDIVTELQTMEGISPIVREQIEALLASEAPVNERLARMQELLIGIESISQSQAMIAALEASELAGESLNDTLEESSNWFATLVTMGKGEQEILSETFSDIPKDLEAAKSEYDELIKRSDELVTNSDEYVDVMGDALEKRKEIADLTKKSESIQSSLNTMVKNEMGLLVLSGDAERDKALALQSIINAQEGSNVHLKKNQDYLDQVTKLIDDQYEGQLKINGVQKETNKLTLVKNTNSKAILKNEREINDAAMDSTSLNDKNIKTYKHMLDTKEDITDAERSLYKGAIDTLEAENEKLDAMDEAITLKENEIALQELELDLKDGHLEMLGQTFEWNALTNQQKIDTLTLLQQEIDGDIVRVENIIAGLQSQILLQDVRNDLDNEAANLAAKYNAELSQSGVLVESQRVSAADRVNQMQGMLADMKASSAALGTKIGTLTTAGVKPTKGARGVAKAGRGVEKADKEAEKAAKKRAKLQEDLAKIQEDLNKKLIDIEEKRISDMRDLAEKDKDRANDKAIDEIHANADLKRAAQERARIERDINDRAIEFRKTLFDAVQGFIGGNLDQIQSVLSKFLTQSERLALELSGISLESSEVVKQNEEDLLTAEADLQIEQAQLNADTADLQDDQRELNLASGKVTDKQSKIDAMRIKIVQMEATFAQSQAQAEAARANQQAQLTAQQVGAAVAKSLGVDASKVADVTAEQAKLILGQVAEAVENSETNWNKFSTEAVKKLQQLVPDAKLGGQQGNELVFGGKSIAFTDFEEMAKVFTDAAGNIPTQQTTAPTQARAITASQFGGVSQADITNQGLILSQMIRDMKLLTESESEFKTNVESGTDSIQDQKDSINVLAQKIKDMKDISMDITDLDLTPLVRATIALDDINERLQTQAELFRQSREAAESGDQVESLRLFAEASKLVTDQELMLIDTMGEFIAEGGKAGELTTQLTSKIEELGAKITSEMNVKDKNEIQERIKEFQNLKDTLVNDVIPAIGSLKDATILSETGAFMAEFDDAGAKSKAFADALSEGRKALLDFAPEAEAAINAIMGDEIGGRGLSNWQAVTLEYQKQKQALDDNVDAIEKQLATLKGIEVVRKGQGLKLTKEELAMQKDLNKALEREVAIREDNEKNRKKDLAKAFLEDTAGALGNVESMGKAVSGIFDVINGDSAELVDNILSAGSGVADFAGKLTGLPIGPVFESAKGVFEVFRKLGELQTRGDDDAIDALTIQLGLIDLLIEKETLRLDVQQKQYDIFRAMNDEAIEQIESAETTAEASRETAGAFFEAFSRNFGGTEIMSDFQLELLQTAGALEGVTSVFTDLGQPVKTAAQANKLFTDTLKDMSPQELIDFYDDLNQKMIDNQAQIDANTIANENQADKWKGSSKDIMATRQNESDFLQEKNDALQGISDETDNLIDLAGGLDDLQRQAIRDKMGDSNFAYEQEKHQIMMTYTDEVEREKALHDLEVKYAHERETNLTDLLALAQEHYDAGLITLAELRDIQLELNSAEYARLELEQAITDEQGDQSELSEKALAELREMHQLRQQMILGGGADPEAIAAVEASIIAKMIAAGASEEAIQDTKDSFQAASYAVGSPYIPSDQLAMVHKGERILTASENMEMIDAVNRLTSMPSIEDLVAPVVSRYMNSMAELGAVGSGGGAVSYSIGDVIVNVPEGVNDADGIAQAIMDNLSEYHEEMHEASGTANGR